MFGHDFGLGLCCGHCQSHGKPFPFGKGGVGMAIDGQMRGLKRCFIFFCLGGGETNYRVFSRCAKKQVFAKLQNAN